MQAYVRGVNLDFSQIFLVQTVENLWKMLRKINKTKQSLATNKAITSLVYSGTRSELSEQFLLRDIFAAIFGWQFNKNNEIKINGWNCPKIARKKYTVTLDISAFAMDYWWLRLIIGNKV